MIDVFFETFSETNPLFILIAGLTIGLLHAFEPDHLAAASSQITLNQNKLKSKKQRLQRLTFNSSLRGAIWGLGHTSSIILVGLLIVGLSLKIPETFFLNVELIVGFLLISLAILTVKNRGFFIHNHIHPHTHSNGITHTHPHSHDSNHKHGHKAYLIGCIQGLAGSGGLVAIAASTMNGFETVIYFLILFGVGSIIGMTIASSVLGLPFVLSSKISLITKYLKYGVALFSAVIGIGIVLTVVLGFNLFSSIVLT